MWEAVARDNIHLRLPGLAPLLSSCVALGEFPKISNHWLPHGDSKHN